MVCKGLFEQCDGFGEAARRLVCACEVVARVQGVGVVVAQDADTVCKGLFEQRDGFGEAARRLVSARDGICSLHMFKIGGNRTECNLSIIKMPR